MDSKLRTADRRVTPQDDWNAGSTVEPMRGFQRTPPAAIVYGVPEFISGMSGKGISMGMKTSIIGGTALLVASAFPLSAQQPTIMTTSLDAVLSGKPLAEGPNRVMQTFIANKSQLQVLTISKIKLHHHEQEDHVVFVARGGGKGRIEVSPGKIEDRTVKTGDIFVLPKNLRHAFEKTGSDDLVLLVVATVGWKPLEDTKFHE